MERSSMKTIVWDVSPRIGGGGGEGGGGRQGLLYKNYVSACRKFLKNTRRGTRISFDGRELNEFEPILKQRISYSVIFSASIP